MAKDSQGALHHLKVVGFRIWQTKGFIYETGQQEENKNK